MEQYYVGFDAGTQSVKVMICNEAMECIATASKPTTLYYPNPGWVQMDMDEYLQIAKICMKDCTDQMKVKGLDVTKIKAVMGDGIICGIAGVNEDGDAITPYINYLDSRTADDVAAMNEKNLSIWGEETGNAEANCMFPAMIARWILKNEEKFQTDGVKFVHNAPYILSHLAGLKAKDICIDWGTMSGWGMGYNIYKKEWSKEQLEILGIDEAYMPKIVKPWDIIGTMTKEVAEETGIPEGTLICAGAGDTMQSMIGSGILEAGHAVDVAGTCAMFCVSTDGIIPELSKRESGLIFNSGTLPDTYFYWGFIRTGGLALRWFKDEICKKAEDGAYYQELSRMAEQVEAGSNGVLFIPYLTGGTGEMVNASGCFLNMTLDTDQGVMWRAVLEAIGYDYMEITDIYRKAGVDLSRIAITEGGSRDDLWNQMKADMLNSRVLTWKSAGGAVVTNCLFASYSVNPEENIKNRLEQYLEVNKNYEPCKENTEKYRKLYQLQKEMMQNDMGAVFASLQKIRNSIK